MAEPDGGGERQRRPQEPERRPQEREIQRAFSKEALGLEEGIHPRMRLTQVHVRIGRRFYSVWWLLPGFALFCAAMVVAFKLSLSTGALTGFVRAHPCEQQRPTFPPGINAWEIATHAANFFFMVMIVRAGWQILADHPRLYLKIHCTPDREWLRFRGPVPKDRVW